MYFPASLTKQKWFHRMNFVFGTQACAGASQGEKSKSAEKTRRQTYLPLSFDGR